MVSGIKHIDHQYLVVPDTIVAQHRLKKTLRGS